MGGNIAFMAPRRRDGMNDIDTPKHRYTRLLSSVIS